MTSASAPTSTHRARLSLARWASLWLFLFMFGIAVWPFFPFTVDSSGYLAAYIKNWLFLILYVYLAIQFNETAMRSSTDMWGFIKDNAIALLCIFVGLAVLLLWGVLPGYRLTPDTLNILLQCLVTAGFDFYFGVVISQRIAFAGKEREETTSPR